MQDCKKLLSDGISRNIRNKYKFAQELADAMGTSKVALHGWKSGNAFPRPETLNEIADKLEVSVAELFATEQEQALIRMNDRPILKELMLKFAMMPDDDIYTTIAILDKIASVSDSISDDNFNILEHIGSNSKVMRLAEMATTLSEKDLTIIINTAKRFSELTTHY